MNVKVIEMALANTEAMNLPHDQRAIAIMTYLEIAEQVSGVGYQTLNSQSIQPTHQPVPAYPSLIVSPGDQSAVMAAPPRMGEGAKKSKVVVSVEEIEHELKRQAPERLKVQLPDGTEVIAIRKVLSMPTADGHGDSGSGFVKLSYAVGSELDAPVYMFDSNQPLNINAGMESIISSIQGRYTSKKRTVTPRPVKPARFDLDEVKRYATGGDADEASGDAGSLTSQWSSSRQGDESAYLSGRSNKI
jgi:hypothetical protein